MLNLKVKRYDGTSYPSQRADPSTPYEIVGERKTTALDADANTTSQDSDDQRYTDQECLNGLYRESVKMRSICGVLTMEVMIFIVLSAG
jgi:hypothetical protein